MTRHLFKPVIPYWLGREEEQRIHNELRAEDEREFTPQAQQSTRDTRQFAAVVPYYALSPDERKALETERTKLIDELPSLEWSVRRRAETRVQEIERQLHLDRTTRGEAERRHAERDQEREAQRTGQPATHSAANGKRGATLVNCRRTGWLGTTE